jgi:iron-sulfur cluster repair protein YtfE (RIC family)
MAIVPTAVDLLKEDHEKVKGLFEKFEKAKSEDEKEEIADQVDLELRVHSMIEEEILYPAMKDIDGEITAESFEEHGVVEELLNELATMDLEEDQFEAKFKVMKENVEHHIEEEENNMFPQCSKIPNYDEIGLKLAQRKKELLDQLRDTDDSERATTKGDPATMKASEKSEAVMAGKPLPGTEKPRKPASRRRSTRASTSSRRKTKAA